MQKSYLIIAAAALTACATTPVPTSEAKNVPSSRILDTGYTQAKEGYGKIIIKRDRGLSASACNTRIYANGSPVAEISTGEKVTIYLPPGDQMLAAMATGICIGGLIETKVAISLNKTAIYRISYGSSGEFTIQPTSF